MKLELSKREVELVIESRAWTKAVGEGQWKVTLAYFLMLAPIIIIPLSCVNLFVAGNITVASIFLFVGMLMIPLSMRIIKKYRTARASIMREVVSEEHKGV
jgi:hypothetical protein